MIVRWLILAVVPYALVPALCVLMTVPAVILLVLTHSASNHVISFVDAEGKPFGLAVSGPGHPLSGGMFGVRRADLRGRGRGLGSRTPRRHVAGPAPDRRSPRTWRTRRRADRGTGGRTPSAVGCRW